MNISLKSFLRCKSRKILPFYTQKDKNFTYLYIGRAHPSIKNISPIAPPKDKLIKAVR